MTRSAHQILFFVVTMALFLSASAWFQDKSNPARPCKGGFLDQPTDCGTQCPRTCEQPRPVPCNRSCKLDACQCVPPSVRRRDGRCVFERDCHIFTPNQI